MPVDENLSSPVVVIRENRVTCVVLNDPGKRSRLTSEMASALPDALFKADDGLGAGSLLLEWRGTVFCSGIDFEAMERVQDLDPFRRFSLRQKLCKPALAAVHGACAGAGIGSFCSVSFAPQFPGTLICDKENQDVQHETPGFRARAGSPEGEQRGPESSRAGKGCWSARRKISVVLELPCGADPESTSRKCGVTAATLPEQRETFQAAGAEGLEIRQEDQVDEQGRHQKQVIAELAMENELLRERIQRMGDEKQYPGWRSKR